MPRDAEESSHDIIAPMIEASPDKDKEREEETEEKDEGGGNRKEEEEEEEKKKKKKKKEEKKKKKRNVKKQMYVPGYAPGYAPGMRRVPLCCGMRRVCAARDERQGGAE